MEVQQGAELIRRLPQQLAAGGELIVALGDVLLAGEGVVDPVVAVLVERRQAGRERRRDRAGHGALDVDRRESRELLGRLGAVELQHAGRGVSAEERALRPAQHFDLVDVEQRIALQDRAFQDHLVVDEADRLRGVEVEVGVAEAADVGPREGAAEAGFERQAGHPGGEHPDVTAGGAGRREPVAAERGHRQGHVVDVLGLLLGSDDDLAHTDRLVRRGGAGSAEHHRGGGCAGSQIGAQRRCASHPVIP